MGAILSTISGLSECFIFMSGMVELRLIITCLVFKKYVNVRLPTNWEFVCRQSVLLTVLICKYLYVDRDTFLTPVNGILMGSSIGTPELLRHSSEWCLRNSEMTLEMSQLLSYLVARGLFMCKWTVLLAQILFLPHSDIYKNKWESQTRLLNWVVISHVIIVGIGYHLCI